MSLRFILRKLAVTVSLLLFVRQASGFSGIDTLHSFGRLHSSSSSSSSLHVMVRKHPSTRGSLVRTLDTSLWQSLSSDALSLSSSQRRDRARGLSFQYATTTTRTLARTTTKALHKTWVALPLFLCLIPVVAAATGTAVATPEWWKLFDVTGLHATTHATTRASALTLFLASNVSYLVTGGSLLRHEGRRLLSAKLFTAPTKKTVLGLWVLSAGLVSTLFHTVQSVPDYATAEALCYLDHGVALTAIFHFWKFQGRPRNKTLPVGALALATLAWPVQDCLVYTAMHSSWHVLSAATAYLWATQPRRVPHDDDKDAPSSYSRLSRRTRAALARHVPNSFSSSTAALVQAPVELVRRRQSRRQQD